jgi:hypothetical protein
VFTAERRGVVFTDVSLSVGGTKSVRFGAGYFSYGRLTNLPLGMTTFKPRGPAKGKK